MRPSKAFPAPSKVLIEETDVQTEKQTEILPSVPEDIIPFEATSKKEWHKLMQSMGARDVRERSWKEFKRGIEGVKGEQGG